MSIGDSFHATLLCFWPPFWERLNSTLCLLKSFMQIQSTKSKQKWQALLQVGVWGSLLFPPEQQPQLLVAWVPKGGWLKHNPHVVHDLWQFVYKGKFNHVEFEVSEASKLADPNRTLTWVKLSTKVVSVHLYPHDKGLIQYQALTTC